MTPKEYRDTLSTGDFYLHIFKSMCWASQCILHGFLTRNLTFVFCHLVPRNIGIRLLEGTMENIEIRLEEGRQKHFIIDEASPDGK